MVSPLRGNVVLSRCLVSSRRNHPVSPLKPTDDQNPDDERLGDRRLSGQKSAESKSNDEPERRRVRIQRKRLGSVRKIDQKGEFGFIEAEDFREDVFFHRTVWQAGISTEASDAPVQTGPLSEELVYTFVEFEIDDELLKTEKKLRAKVVRPTKRPRGRKLSGRDATFKIITHHPNARRKKPRWRR